VGVTMTFNKTKRGYYTIVGNSVEECCHSLEQAGADFIGANCTLDCQGMEGLSTLLSEHASVPVLLQPNAGQPETKGNAIIYHSTPDDFATGVENLLSDKVRAIGGCCGTTPSHIRTLRQMLTKRFSS